MELGAVHQLVDAVEAVGAGADRAALREAMERCQRLAGWVEAQRLRLVSALAADLTVFPEQAVADVARVGIREGERVVARAGVTAAAPVMADSLAAGQVSAGHVDVVANGLRKLDASGREALLADMERLTRLAETSTVGTFREAVERDVQRLQNDGGLAHFERQRRAARLRTWTDASSGMVCGRFELDPEQGGGFLTGLRATVERLFHDRQPDTCPADLLERQHHLQALALMAMVNGKGAGGSIRMAVVADLDTLRHGLHERSIATTSCGVSLPVETIRRLACEADLIPVVLDRRGVALDLGRTARLATASQRVALSTMFATCFAPGCTVPFDQCQVHHLAPFERGGRTDLVNLRPVCSWHHHALHEGGWKVEGEGWCVTLVTPDGQRVRAGPHRARAA